MADLRHGATLLVDVGNTRIKWARLHRGRLGRQHAAPYSRWRASDFSREIFAHCAGVTRIVVASVAGDAAARALRRAALRTLRIEPQFAATSARAAQVRNAYGEPWRLGVDRWVAVIGAHHLQPRRAACVVDIGTAMTIDLVDSNGRHHGGMILPGPQLMVASLLHNTSGIRWRAAARTHLKTSPFARDTRQGLELGARLATAAAIDRAWRAATQELGEAPRLIVTGGAAAAISAQLDSPHRIIPDLVLRGLAVLARELD
jgi:type III pantothenate kinase